MSEQIKVLLTEDEMPKQWYNIQADLPHPLPPPVDKDGKPIGPEALAGGPIGKLRDGDVVEILIDRKTLTGSINLIGQADTAQAFCSIELGSRILAERAINPLFAAVEPLEDDIRLWAATQNGTWRGCVADVDRVVKAMSAFCGVN